MYNIIDLAEMQLQREGNLNKINVVDLLFARAVKIRHYFDMQNRNQKVADNRRRNLLQIKK